MKTLFSIIINFFLVTSIVAQNHAPVVTNVTAQQRTGTKLVDITYSVSDADNDTLTITVQVSNDSGRTFTITPVSLTGAVGSGIRPGTRKTIVWNAGVDYPNQYGTKFQVKVIANDNKSGIITLNDGYGDYVFVPAGSFQMGDNFNEGGSGERPVHTVTLNAYYIGKYEVTNAEYKKFMDDGGYTTESYWTAGGFGQYGSQPYYWTNSSYRGGGISGNENFPVVGVSWYEANAYCKWLSAKTGKVYRLPTEAEWENAARGTDQRRYPWGNIIDSTYANYVNSGDPYDNGSVSGLTPVGYYDGTTHGSFSTHNNASPYGAYDMAGNVWEWCYDWWSDSYYTSSPTNNPTGPISGSSRVLRGSGWNYDSTYLRSARRSYLNPIPGYFSVGIRCLREQDQVINDGYGDYVFVPAGSFQMGDNFDEGISNEKPVHTVTLNAYYIGKYEVTNAEYKKFIDDGGYTTQSYWTAGGYGNYGNQPDFWNIDKVGGYNIHGGGISGNEDYPVVGVSWYEASAYCKWLSAKTSKTYRLPTEAEWEKAARGDDAKNSTLGHQRRYPWGDTIDGSYANYIGSGDPYDNGLTPAGYYDGTTHGSFSTHNNASPYGAYDMAGNVWEWCYDWYGSYSSGAVTNPTGPSTGSDRLFRGGSWYYNTHNLRSASRFADDPVIRPYGIGLRCLKEQ